MIIAIGIDSIEIKRFAHWHTYTDTQLQRIFSAHEISYCLNNKQKLAERFAVRFAAREALWKAVCQAWPEHEIPFLFLCRNIEILHTPKGVPFFNFHQLLANQAPFLTESNIHISLTHTRDIATAIALISSS